MSFELIKDDTPGKREPEQSKEKVLQVRFTPRDIEDLRRSCVDKNTTFCEFVRKGVRLLKIYYDYAEILLSNSDEIIPLLKIIPRKF